MSEPGLPDGPESRWIASINLRPFRRAVLAHLATFRDTPAGLLQRMAGQGWWFLGAGRLYPALYSLERLGLVSSQWQGPPPADPDQGRRREYWATRTGILWLNAHAASGRPPNRDEWAILRALADAGGSATGFGLADILEIPTRRLVKAAQQLETGGYIAKDWNEDTTSFRRIRFELTPQGRALLELARANHGG